MPGQSEPYSGTRNEVKKEQHDARRGENEKRKEVLRKASSIPHQEAKISVAGQVEKKFAPLAEDVRRLKELSEQKNRRALDAADPARDTGRSAASAHAGTQPNAKLRLEHRQEAPRARHTDPYQRRNSRVEVREQPSPGYHLPSFSSCCAGRRPGKWERRRAAHKVQTQAQGAEPGGHMMGTDIHSKSASKRQKVESTRPTYLSRTELLELDQDQLVGNILMRMTPWQPETRCTRNVMHLVLSESKGASPYGAIQQCIVLHTLLGKGPCFMPKASPLSTTEVQKACARLGYRLVIAFERYVEGGYHEQKAQAMKEAGI
jgi:hypothetical protein